MSATALVLTMLAGLVPAAVEGPARCTPRLEPITGHALIDHWIAQPTREELVAAFPKQAVQERVSGRVDLLCGVGRDGGLIDCQVQDESVEGYGFADAALRLSRRFRIDDTLQGCPTAGLRVGFPINFRVR